MKNKEIIIWLNTHPLFSINGMCKIIKIDTGNFSRYISRGTIPEKYLLPIERVIKDYGFNSLKK